MLSPSLIRTVVRTCENIPSTTIDDACAILIARNEPALLAVNSLAGTLSKDSLSALKKAVTQSPVSARELGFAMKFAAAGIEMGRDSPEIHLVWTGPETPRPSPRDTLPQMLEMVGRAQDSILLVTFAAFKAKPIMKALSDALKRGVSIAIIVESTEASAGQLTHDAWKAFPPALIEAGSLWYWPTKKRPTNPKGLPAKLHAKCLVIDRREALVSSANLTDDAMERNIEVGVRWTGGSCAADLHDKFASMMSAGELVRLPKV